MHEPKRPLGRDKAKKAASPAAPSKVLEWSTCIVRGVKGKEKEGEPQHRFGEGRERGREWVCGNDVALRRQWGRWRKGEPLRIS
ncbi:hypothetical protein L1987_24197 [Smallanthus sonchifolius]|uniref:Uncharacterized protein n=1 Tax=Smallanthus sonchifolius TaxID=185202 RepID=A0ACB9IL43_9ASTR|nr:hypothetical protein L1987_24197 [Smallanthus sonchifolius]